ncbi:Methyltransferase domain [Candidatus Methylocalor cossyra]|uniref:Methyltransferase domain n=2 Tax=Candidatus Methylocalor cossyra TaxID=3108543 RepID=A0ABM9NHV2_9GAMM
MNDPSRELFENYERYYTGFDTSLEDIRKFHLERVPRWLDRIDKQARILDAGCAKGYLLSLLHRLGYSDLRGVDLSESLAAQARSILPPSVMIETADIRDYLGKTPDESFDVILFHHVLEHLPREHTIPVLRSFRRCLKGGGYLSIRVPNVSSLMGSINCFWDFTHVIYFNERSLLQVLDAAGFDVSKAELILHPPRLYWSWRHPVRAVFRLLNRLRWHLNNAIHYGLCLLQDIRPIPKVFEWEIEVLIKK